MKTFILIALSMIAIQTSTAFAESITAEAYIYESQGDGGGPCGTGYMISGQDLNSEITAKFNLCVKLAKDVKFGSNAEFKISNLKRAAKKRFHINRLSLLEGETLIVSGDANYGTAEFTINVAEIKHEN